MYDLEAFQSKMEEVRKWKYERSKIEWDKLRDDDSLHEDELGPPYSLMRVDVPGWMIPMDTRDDGTHNSEEKLLTQQTKPKVLTEEKQKQLAAETALGFSRLEMPTFSNAQLRQPLPACAATREQLAWGKC